MPLDPSKITSNIKPEQKLWRYMSLEKLIDILSKKQIFFTPLSSYVNSDPFEGLVPKIALQPFVDMGSNYIDEQKKILIETKKKLFENIVLDNKGWSTIHEALDYLHQQNINRRKSEIEKAFLNLKKVIVINCWHQNETESEAMWRLYSDNNKGVAIQTTFSNLIESINDDRVYFSEVKYIDFYDETLSKNDVEFFNGKFSLPLLKRKAFQHEHEARLFFARDINEEDGYVPDLIDIDITKLISKIYISPYCSELYANSVRNIVEKFGIKSNLVEHSELLKVDSKLTVIF